MLERLKPGLAGGLVLGALAFALTANATQIIVNGGFESNLTGWTITNSAAATGSWFASTTTTTPLNGNPTVGPFSGTHYAVTDDFGPETHALTQTFVVPVGPVTAANLSFEVFVNDRFGASGTGGKVDLLAGNANPLTGVAITTFFSADTATANGAPNPYVLTNLNIAAFLTGGTTYQLRFIESSATGPINMGVDAVSLDINPTPEPSSMLEMLMVLAGAVFYKGRRSHG
jgi:hypothetical protein